jgi:hypothetical protein
MRQPIKKVVNEPTTANISEPLITQVQDTGATIIVTVISGTLTAKAKLKIACRYPGAIIIG